MVANEEIFYPQRTIPLKHRRKASAPKKQTNKQNKTKTKKQKQKHFVTGESMTRVDSPVPLIRNDPDRSWITDPDPDHPKGRNAA